MNSEELLQVLINNNAFVDNIKTRLSSGIVRYINRRPEIITELQSVTKIQSSNVPELIYNLVNPSCNKTCQICGKPVAFQKYYNGYAKTCSKKCASTLSSRKSADTKKERYGSASYNNKEKAEETCLKRYGDAHYVNSNARKSTCAARYGQKWHNNTEKGKHTCMQRFGVDNVMKLDAFKEKQKQSNLIKYGVPYAMQNAEVVSQYKANCKKKTGYDWHTQDPEFHKKKEENQKREILEFEEKNNCTERKKLIEKYGQSWLSLNLPFIKNKKFLFYSNEYIPQIQKCKEDYLNNSSSYEREIYEYCQSFLPHVEILRKYRGLLKSEDFHSLELDIYVPEKSIAIEFNGMYWHSFKDSNYHLYKTEECEKKGIRLIHIWEDLWISKKSIYKSIIASALGVYNKRIYARDCECREIDGEEYRTFLENNHIQGPVNSAIKLGLFYGGELVQVAGWGKSRFKRGEYELHRMCSKLNTQVVGGFSKLIKHSGLKNFISYVDRSLYNGKGYKSSGFKVLEYTKPGYFYYSTKKKDIRINRVSAQKHRLSKLLENFDLSLTEEDNMLNNGYRRIYDCGNIKVEYAAK
jgi:hypothetical protein